MEEVVLSERVDAAEEAAMAATTNVKVSGDKEQSDLLLSLILDQLDEDKAEDVVSIPLTGKSEMADNMIVASGRSSRQVQSIAEKLGKRIKDEFGIVCRQEGKQSGDWVLIDCGDAIVHLFRPEVREFYQIEKMWLGTSPEPKQA